MKSKKIKYIVKISLLNHPEFSPKYYEYSSKRELRYELEYYNDFKEDYCVRIFEVKELEEI